MVETFEKSLTATITEQRRLRLGRKLCVLPAILRATGVPLEPIYYSGRSMRQGWPLTPRPILYPRPLNEAKGSPVIPCETTLFVAQAFRKGSTPLEVFHYFPAEGGNDTVATLDDEWIAGYDQPPENWKGWPTLRADTPHLNSAALTELVDQYVAAHGLGHRVAYALAAMHPTPPSV